MPRTKERGSKRDSQLGSGRDYRKRPADEAVHSQSAKKSRDDAADEAKPATSGAKRLRPGQRVLRVGRGNHASDLGMAGIVRSVDGGKVKVDAEGVRGGWEPQNAANFTDLGLTPTPAQAQQMLLRRDWLAEQIEQLQKQLADAATADAFSRSMLQFSLAPVLHQLQMQQHGLTNMIDQLLTPLQCGLVREHGAMTTGTHRVQLLTYAGADRPVGAIASHAGAVLARRTGCHCSPLCLGCLDAEESERLCREVKHGHGPAGTLSLKKSCLGCLDAEESERLCREVKHGHGPAGTLSLKCNCLGCLDAEESERLCREAKHGHGPGGTLQLKTSCKTCRLIAYLEKAEGLPIQQIEIGLKQRRAAKVSHP